MRIIRNLIINIKKNGIKTTSKQVIYRLIGKTKKDEVKKKPINLITNFEEYDGFIAKYNQLGFGGKINKSEREYLDSHELDFMSFVKSFGSKPPKCDPFSQEYINWEMSFFNYLSGREYDFQSEGAPLSHMGELIVSPRQYIGMSRLNLYI